MTEPYFDLTISDKVQIVILAKVEQKVSPSFLNALDHRRVLSQTAQIKILCRAQVLLHQHPIPTKSMQLPNCHINLGIWWQVNELLKRLLLLQETKEHPGLC